MSRPLPAPVLFLDECLGTGDVAGVLRAQGIQVEILLDHLQRGTADDVWLSEVGKRGWVVLTKDTWIRRREAERQALHAAGVAAFVLKAGDLTGAEMAQAFLAAYPRICKLLRDHEPPLIASVGTKGTVTLLTESPRRASKRKPG